VEGTCCRQNDLTDKINSKIYIWLIKEQYLKAIGEFQNPRCLVSFHMLPLDNVSSYWMIAKSYKHVATTVFLDSVLVVSRIFVSLSVTVHEAEKSTLNLACRT
jgi:hypothetical protein